MSAYAQLEKSFHRLANIEGATAILDWDWAVIMPKGSAESRSNQLSELSLIRYEILADPKLGDLLCDAEAKKEHLDDWQRANLKEMRHNWMHANSMQPDLIVALNQTTSKCEMLWREARKNNDFKSFSKGFRPLLKLIREKAEAKSAVFKMPLYDVLMDEYDPGITTRDIDKHFSDLQLFLPSLLDEIIDRQGNQTVPIMPKGPFNLIKQKELSLKLMEKIGFNFDSGRLDESHHPFCGGVPGDVRITTKYDEDDFTSSMMAVLHETGHALYERGLPKDWRHQPVGKAPSMSLHESQSLLLEMQVCRSREFFSFASPLIKTLLSNTKSKCLLRFDPENLYRLAIRVAPGPIRIYADEVTYPLHVMLRYHLEKEMIEGGIQVNDLPDAWEQWMNDLLGVMPKNHGEGCLQDIHWATGEIGYFPSYTLGALIAAQIFEKVEREIKQVKSDIAIGDFSSLMSWLLESVHSQGSCYSTQDLVERVTGRPLDTRAFEVHLRTRYLS